MLTQQQQTGSGDRVELHIICEGPRILNNSVTMLPSSECNNISKNLKQFSIYYVSTYRPRLWFFQLHNICLYVTNIILCKNDIIIQVSQLVIQFLHQMIILNNLNQLILKQAKVCGTLMTNLQMKNLISYSIAKMLVHSSQILNTLFSSYTQWTIDWLVDWVFNGTSICAHCEGVKPAQAAKEMEIL